MDMENITTDNAVQNDRADYDKVAQAQAALEALELDYVYVKAGRFCWSLHSGFGLVTEPGEAASSFAVRPSYEAAVAYLQGYAYAKARESGK